MDMETYEQIQDIRRRVKFGLLALGLFTLITAVVFSNAIIKTINKHHNMMIVGIRCVGRSIDEFNRRD